MLRTNYARGNKILGVKMTHKPRENFEVRRFAPCIPVIRVSLKEIIKKGKSLIYEDVQSISHQSQT